MRVGRTSAALPKICRSRRTLLSATSLSVGNLFMFERYTEKARRVIFFARYEASQFGAPAIEPEHLLLGLMREDKSLTARFFPRAQITIESIRREIEGRTLLRERIPT